MKAVKFFGIVLLGITIDTILYAIARLLRAIVKERLIQRMIILAPLAIMFLFFLSMVIIVFD